MLVVAPFVAILLAIGLLGWWWHRRGEVHVGGFRHPAPAPAPLDDPAPPPHHPVGEALPPWPSWSERFSRQMEDVQSRFRKPRALRRVNGRWVP